MGEAFRWPGGGLPGEARALMIPENIRAGVHIKGGGVDVTGALIGAKAIAAFTSCGGWLDDWQTAVMIRACGLGYGYIDSKSTYADTEGSATMTIPIKTTFRGYMVAETGNIGLTYNGIAVSTNVQEPTTFTAGTNLSMWGKYVGASRSIWSCYIMLV